MCLKLPPVNKAEDVRAAYRLIVEFALRHDLVVYDPQIGTEIDLHNPGDFPPMWAPKKEQSERGHGWSPWRKRGS